MATIDQIVYDIAEQLKRADDFTFRERVRFEFINLRSKFIRQDVTRNGLVSPHVIQEIGCIPTIKVDAAECFGFDVGIKTVRTVYKVPRPIRLKGFGTFLFVGSIDWAHSYSEIDPNRVQYLKEETFSASMPRYTYRNGYVYLIGKYPEKISIRAAFENPDELMEFKDCNGQPIYTDDSPFPMGIDMINDISDVIVAKEAALGKPEAEPEVQFDEQ